MGTIKRRVALITGGSRGIGRAIAIRLASAGNAVAVIGKSGGRNLEDTKKEVERLGVPCVALKSDVSHRDQVGRMFEEVERQLGVVDILVNNAAIADPGHGRGWEIPESDWDRMYEVNLKGVFLCCAAAVPGMVQRGWGRIINISSTSGISGGTSGVHYAATKGGVNALTKALALEVAEFGITANVVAPSKIETEMFRQAVPPEYRETTINKIPVKRPGQPDEIAESVAYFAGEKAGYTTGQILVVSGGY
jgi:3-oxoacyl-[acyl-carrier protein] reductase